MMTPTELVEKDKPLEKGARRREKSRDAARSRRQQESDTFNEICKSIPVPAKQLAQMDRSTVMRLLISFMKLRNITSSMELMNEEIKQEISIEMPRNEEYINALNGFIIVLSQDCDIVFVSTNVKQYIGIASLDLMGQNLFGYTHEGDHSEITNCLKTSSEERKAHLFFMRMKSTLTSSGRNVNLKSARYKVLKCEGLVSQSADLNQAYMIAYCEPIPHPANIEMVLDCSTFLSQHSLNMKFTFCDTERALSLMGYDKDEMIGQSFYNYCHTEDIKGLDNAMKKLFRLGQVTTNQYRMLAKHGGYVWVISQATIINNPRNQQPSYIVCVHYVISGVIDGNSIVSLPQLEFSESSVNTLVKEEIEEIPKDELGPLDCTEALFCDSTNSIFCDNMLDDGPDVPLSSDANSDVLIPFTESMEMMASNAPSIGDEVGCTQFSFNDTGIDDLYNNAPSIGDPLLQYPFVTPVQQGASVFPDNNVNLDQMNGFLMEEYNGGHTTASEAKVKIQDWPQRSTTQRYTGLPTSPMPISKAPQRRLPTGDFQIVTIPKSQYKRHIQPEMNIRRDVVYKVNPPGDPPMKKHKCQNLVGSSLLNTQWEKPYSEIPCSTRKTQFLLKRECNPGDTHSLTSFLLRPGHKCDNFDFGMDPRDPSRDSDPSWPLSPIAQNSSLLPVLSLYDCEVNAPVNNSSSTLDWVALSSALSSVS